ncbi:MAG: CDP-alcohol phosphatidyltransferase family protein [Leptospira sp.]|nr:CDP-alcohol phosphatidyltransferase family protein [Leptospira sp.]
MIVQEKKAKELLQDKIFTLSNFLSISRVLLVPPFLLYSKDYASNPTYETFFYPFLICAIAVLTDYLDGKFARLLKQETILGRYLDPVCDKIVTICGLGVVVYYFDFPLWILIVYFLRELLGVTFGGYLYFKRGLQGKPNWWGKLGVGIVAWSVVWYMALPLLHTIPDLPALFFYPEWSGYILMVVLILGIIGYAQRYWNIVFHPEKQVIDPDDKNQKKKYEVI